MNLADSITISQAQTTSAWNLDWLTPMRCRLILLAVLVLGFVSHVRYLNHNCPIDLSGDEAQYWDWSRHLDLSYYSKGPLIAYIIRGSCAVFGDTMPAVRYPALLIGVMTSLVTYLLTRKLFGSERLALGAALLFCVVPMFVAGSTLMTIDPPMFLCWALATYFAVIAIFEDRSWAWLLVGASIGIGFLAKYAAFLWFVGLFGFLFVHRRHGRKSVMGATIALLIACVFTLPVIIWNQRHGWASLHHVAHQTGASSGSFSIMNVLELLLTQIGAVGPTLAFLMILAVIYAIRSRSDQNEPHRDKLMLLAWIGVAYFAFNVLASIRAKVQPNWPAPAYFTLLILTAYFLATRLRSLETWKTVRGWFWATILIGVVFIPIAHDTSLIYPLLRPIARLSHRDLREMDPLARLRGWHTLGRYVSDRLLEMPPGTFVLCDDYQQTAEMAFYVEHHPKTYCAGPYFDDPKRLSQYDMWADRRLDPSSPLVGKDAIYVGKGGRIPAEVKAAFRHVGKIELIPIVVNGFPVRDFKVWECRGFKGMRRQPWQTY